MNILMVTSSPRGEAAHSTALANALLGTLHTANPDASVVVRDLIASPPPYIDQAFVSGQAVAADQRSEAQAAAIATSDLYGAEFAAADTIIIAAAMINFSIPAQLRSWFDSLLRAGLTFRYTSKGSVGMMGGRKVYLVVARGGFYSEGRFKDADFQIPYLRTLLGFMGIDDIEVINAEGLALGPDSVKAATDAALAQIAQLVEA